MELDIKRRIEVETLAEIIGNLNFYQILKLRDGAPMALVEKAYADQSSKFHPDRFFGVRDPKLMRKVTKIFKKISEAYQVLKDSELKRRYDIKMGFRESRGIGGGEAGTATGGAVTRKSLQAEAQAEAQADEEIVTDPKARKYYDLAVIALQNEDWQGAVMNLQFTLTYDPNNEVVKEQLADAKVKKAAKKAKQVDNPYRIKIV